MRTVGEGGFLPETTKDNSSTQMIAHFSGKAANRNEIFFR